MIDLLPRRVFPNEFYWNNRIYLKIDWIESKYAIICVNLKKFHDSYPNLISIFAE